MSTRSIIIKSSIAALSGFVLFQSVTNNLWWLSFVSIAVFYYSVSGTTFRYRMLFSTKFAICYFGPFLWWIHVVGFDAFVLLTLLCSLFFLLVFAIPGSQIWWMRILQFASCWTLVELLRSNFPWGGFPWALIGYGQVDGPFIDYARIGGTGALAFIVCLTSACIVEAIERKKIWLIGIPAVLALMPFSVSSTAASGTLNVVAVQGSVPQTGVNDYWQRSEVLERHLTLTKKHAQEISKSDIVIWPESAAGNDPLHDELVKNEIQQTVNEIGTPLLVGGTTWQDNPYGPRNVGILWLPNTGPTNVYIKNHLVPFGEYIPMRKMLSGFIKRFEKVPNDFVAGNGGGVISVDKFSFGDAICFEVAYDDHLRNLVKGGAQFFTAQSNNSTYSGTSQPRQQFQITRFRAVEHQRAVVVATTTGVSGIISSDGRILSKSRGDGGEVLQAKIASSQNKQFADTFGYTFELCSLFIVLFSALERTLISRRKQAQPIQ